MPGLHTHQLTAAGDSAAEAARLIVQSVQAHAGDPASLRDAVVLIPDAHAAPDTEDRIKDCSDRV